MFHENNVLCFWKVIHWYEVGEGKFQLFGDFFLSFFLKLLKAILLIKNAT